MTRFWRDGFWRTSVYGVEHFVEGHWVERDDWERTGSSRIVPASYYEHRLREARGWSSATARLVVPNATCPVCGADVFFYRNDHGSRVYFDELGPPWPKHPCTDNATHRRRVGRVTDFAPAAPQPRAEEDVKLLRSWDARGGFDPEFDFGQRYGRGRWSAWRVARRLRGRDCTCLILSAVEAQGSRRSFVRRPHFPRTISEGDTVFLHRGWLAYLDRETLEPMELEFQRLASASALVEALTGGSTAT